MLWSWRGLSGLRWVWSLQRLLISEHRFYGTRASVVVADRLSCGSWASEHMLRSCAQAQLPRGMWNLPRPEIKPVSPALAGESLITGPPGKSLQLAFTRMLVASWSSPECSSCQAEVQGLPLVRCTHEDTRASAGRCWALFVSWLLADPRQKI